jgi:transposase
VPGPTTCPCCGSSRLAKLGEDVIETLEVVPRQWKVVQTVREKFTCRDCEKISQAPAPFSVLSRGFAGPSLLAMILFEKYGQHQPLNRQSERYTREGIELSVATLADQVGGCASLLRPLYELIRAHVFAGDRVHGDETPVPVLARHQTRKSRLWVYVRDDKPFAGLLRRSRCSSPRATGRPSIRRVICTATLESFRLSVLKTSSTYEFAFEVLWDSLRFMAGRLSRWISALRARIRCRGELLLELIVLRHQIAVLQRTGTCRPCFRPSDRLFWVLLSRWWVNWQRNLMIVQPATVLRWSRQGLWAIWTSGSPRRWRGGRPRIDSEIRALILRMSQENFLWGAPRIHGELLKLGFDVSQATVSRYMPRRGYPPSQNWRTFLRNQAAGLGMIGFAEAGQRSEKPLTLVRGWIERIARFATRMEDHLSCAPLKPSRTLPALRSSRISNRADRRAAPNGYIRVHPQHTGRDRYRRMTAGSGPAAYRARASPARKSSTWASSQRFARVCLCSQLSSKEERRARDCRDPSRARTDYRDQPGDSLRRHSLC